MPDRVSLPACTAVAKILHPPTTKYTHGFDGSLDSWTNFVGLGAYLPGQHSGAAAALDTGSPAATRTHSRTVTGLTIGRSYTFTAWVCLATQSSTVALGVSGIGSATAVTLIARKWRQVWYRFTATATSHSLQIIMVHANNFTAMVDDVKLVEDQYVVASVPLELKPNSSITLDERRAPYAEAVLRVALPAQADLDLLDTRTTNQVRVVITASQTITAPAPDTQSRTFDLLLHHRDADHSSGASVQLICRSDEALLIDAGNATAVVDSKLVSEQTSLRSMIATILAVHNATLEQGTTDADFTITTGLTNLITNPSGEVNATGYTSALGSATIARSTAASGPGAAFGTACITATATTTSMGIAPSAISATWPVTELLPYWASVYLGASVTRNAQLFLRWYDVSGVQISQVSTAATSIPGPLASFGIQTRLSINGTAPAGAVKALMFVTVTTCAVGNILYTDGWSLTQNGDAATTWFDGPAYFDGATATDTFYSYAWNGTAHASTSRRIRLDSRAPLLLIQEPGETDWDILQQIVQVSGLRLFCDEQRRWYLVDPATYVVAGTAALEGAKRGRDSTSRESGDWCDAVVVEYRWIDDDGIPQVEWDAATAGGTCLKLVRWDRPYPGPGAAAAILARYQSRGRVQEIVVPFDLTSTPGMALTTALPNTPDQEGYVSRVSWALGPFDTTVGARDLVDA